MCKVLKSKEIEEGKRRRKNERRGFRFFDSKFT